MGLVKVSSIGVSIDGFSAGPNQDLEHPLGVGGQAVFSWFFPTQTFKRMYGDDAGSTGIDNDFAAAGFVDVGAWIIGRNMFGPVRGPWPDDAWKGWWGDEPPYHVPVFVLTQYPRASLMMQGGTVFHFVTEGFQVALQRARQAAGDKHVRVGGGVATILQYLSAGLVDEIHIAMAPVLLGQGERLFGNVNLAALGYQCNSVTQGEKATHYVMSRVDGAAST